MVLYFTALLLPHDAAGMILAVKEHFRDAFQCKVALRSPAHITLLPPWRMDPSLQNDWIALMDNLAAQQAVFPVEAKGWGAFGKRTLFLEPVLSLVLSSLKKDSDHCAAAHPQFGALPDSRPFHPHVTVANRDLQRDNFSTAHNWLCTQPFPRTWEARGITTLRYGQKKWDVLHTSRFLL